MSGGNIRIVLNLALAILFFWVISTGKLEAAGTTGPSTEQSLDELEKRHQEYDNFGWPPNAWFNNDSAWLKSYSEFNRKQWVENGIGWLIAPTLMMQKGSQVSDKDFTTNYQHNVLFVWRPIRDTTWGTGTFIFNYLQVYQTSNVTGIDMTGDLGLTYPISDSVGDSKAIKALYWQQDFAGGVGDLKFGHIELNGIVNKCTYMCDDTQGFIAGPFSTNVASTMAGQGWGIQVGLNLGEKVKVEFGVSDGNGDGMLNFDRGVNTSELGYAAAVSFNNLLPDLGAGSIRLATYYVDATTGSGTTQASTRGFVLNAEQDVGRIGYSLRYARADGRVGATRHSGAASLVWKAPFGHDTDWLGFGLGYVQPSASASKRENMAEVFYRMQLTPLSQITAGVMLVESNKNTENPSRNEGIFNLRLRVAF